MADYGIIREQVRTVVDPLFLRLKEELYGSGISYGYIVPGKLPPDVVYGGNVGDQVDALGYIKGIDIYSGGTLIGTDIKELSFLGPGIVIVSDRATIDIATPLSQKVTNPMTSAGDIIYGLAGGVPVRRAVGADGQYLSVVAGVPQWVSIASGTGGALNDPTVDIGDLIYRSGGGVTRRAIGASGQVLQVSGGEPVWSDPPLTGMQNPMTTLGDLIEGGSSGTPLRLAIGTEGYRLTVSGGIPQWAPLPTDVGFANPMTVDGDIIYRSGGLPARLGIGTSAQILAVSGGLPYWASISLIVSGLIDPTIGVGDMIYRDVAGLTNLSIGDDGQVLGVSNGIPEWQSISISGASSTPFGVIYNPIDIITGTPDVANDEFDTASLDTAGTRTAGATPWVWVNQGSATATQSNSRLVIKAPASLGAGIRGVFQATSGSTWRYIAKIGRLMCNGGAYGGIAVRDSVGGNSEIFYIYPGALIGINQYNSSFNYAGNPVAGFTSPVGLTLGYLEVELTSTNLIYRIYDLYGELTQQVATWSKTAFLASAPDQIGLAIESNGVSSENGIIIDWLHKAA